MLRGRQGAALPEAAARAGEVGPGDKGRGPRCGGGHPEGVADLRASRGRRADWGEPPAALYPARLRARVQRAERGGGVPVQVRQLLRAAVRGRDSLGRPGLGHRLEGAGGQGDSVGEGHETSEAGSISREYAIHIQTITTAP